MNSDLRNKAERIVSTVNLWQVMKSPNELNGASITVCYDIEEGVLDVAENIFYEDAELIVGSADVIRELLAEIERLEMKIGGPTV